MEKPGDELKDLFFINLHDFEMKPPQGLWDSLSQKLDAELAAGNKGESDKVLILFRQKFADFRKNPPETVWNKIEQHSIRQNRRRLLIFATAAAAMLLLALLPLRMMIFNPVTEIPSGLSKTSQLSTPLEQVVSNAREAKAQTESSQQRTSKTLAMSSFAPGSESHAGNQPLSPEVNKQEVEYNAVFEEKVNEAIVSAETNFLPEEKPAPAEDRMSRALLAARILNQKADFELDDQRRKEKAARERYNVSLAYGSVPGGSVSATELLYENTNVRYRNDAFQSEMAYQTSFYEEIESTDVNPPLTLGLKLSYQVGKRIHLETGISYTSLSVISKSVEMENAYNEYERSLYYLGLPVGLRWDAVRAKQFRLYLAQSVMIEKGLRAVNRNLHYEKNKLFESSHYGMNIPGFQLSSLTTAGADLSLYNNFSMFGEAGLQVFFLNSTQPFSMRSAKMAWPVFQTGIRMNF